MTRRFTEEVVNLFAVDLHNGHVYAVQPVASSLASHGEYLAHRVEVNTWLCGCALYQNNIQEAIVTGSNCKQEAMVTGRDGKQEAIVTGRDGKQEAMVNRKQ